MKIKIEVLAFALSFFNLCAARTAIADTQKLLLVSSSLTVTHPIPYVHIPHAYVM